MVRRAPVNAMNSRRLSLLGIAVGAMLAVTGCTKDEPAASKPADTSAGAPSQSANPVVTLLVTADESGWLLAEDGQGGAAETLGKWVADEKHCVGALGANGAPSCPQDSNIVLSVGNHFNGPAISSFFHGEPTAEVMKRMGYAASGFGNHELDFGKEQFLKNRQIGGFPYVAANLTTKSADAKDLQLPAFVLVERQGIKVAVIALARRSAAQTGMAGRFEGLEISPIEAALGDAVRKAWAAGADAIAVLSDDCGNELDEALSLHADWKVSVAAVDHCSAPTDRKAGSVPVVFPGKHFNSYLRAKLSFDRSKPVQQRLTGVETAVVPVQGATPDADTAALIARFKQKTDAALGEQIGFTKSGLPQGSDALGKWITTAWRDSLKADVAVINKKGLRQGISPGKITQASVYSVLPFENSLLVAKITGADLATELANDQALYSGVTKAGKGWKDARGKAIDPKKTYSVATVEYLYFGGDGFGFEKHDPLPTETGMMAQTPIVDWTKKQATTETKPLEKLLK